MTTRPMHTLHIASTFDDGHTDEWAYDQPGHAVTAHQGLVTRWKAAGYVFDRDRAELRLTRVIEHPELGTYTDVITHIPWSDR